MIDKVIYKVGDKYVYVLDWISVYVRYVLYEINWVERGYYIYGRDSVIIFDMGDVGECIKRVIKGVIILY